MKRPLKNRLGTTLVELVVCMALLGIFSVAAIALIQPAVETFTEMQQLTQAENLADIIIEELRGEMLHAQGYIRLSAADKGEPALGNDLTVFQAAEDPRMGTAVQFRVPEGYILLLDAGYVPATTYGKNDAPDPVNLGGTLHLRYYTDEINENKWYGNPVHTKNGVTGEYAYAGTDAIPLNSYMGMTIELDFRVRTWEQSEESGAVYVTSLMVQVTINDALGNPICAQKGILPLPEKPELIAEPGKWRGNSST